MSEQAVIPKDPLFVWGEDVCSKKHGGNPESESAQEGRKGKAAAQRARVIEAIRASGARGLTVDELAASWNVAPNAISGRFTELKALGKITKAGTRKTRSGSRAGVYVCNGGAVVPGTPERSEKGQPNE